MQNNLCPSCSTAHMSGSATQGVNIPINELLLAEIACTGQATTDSPHSKLFNSIGISTLQLSRQKAFGAKMSIPSHSPVMPELTDPSCVQRELPFMSFSVW